MSAPTKVSTAQDVKAPVFATLDSLLKHHDSAQCKDCHETVHKESTSRIRPGSSQRETRSRRSASTAPAATVKGTADPMRPPDPNVRYGSTGAAAPHPTQATPVMQSSAFCAQCHALWYAKDSEYLYCTTIFESHQNAYRGVGGTQSCQDCHMKAKGHTFPGAHNQALVKEGLTLAMVWQEVGIDLGGEQKVKAWEIKNTIDLALQPRRTPTEQLQIPFPDGTTAAEIEATLTYHHRPGEEFIVRRTTRRPAFRK